MKSVPVKRSPILVSTFAERPFTVVSPVIAGSQMYGVTAKVQLGSLPDPAHAGDWRDQMLRRAAAAVQVAGKGADQIRMLPQLLVSRRLPQLDAAMRAWARKDAVVANAVASADELRVRAVAAMFKEAGLDDQRARERARILWWVFLGSRGADEPERLRAFRELTVALLHDADA